MLSIAANWQMIIRMLNDSYQEKTSIKSQQGLISKTKSRPFGRSTQQFGRLHFTII